MYQTFTLNDNRHVRARVLWQNHRMYGKMCIQISLVIAENDLCWIYEEIDADDCVRYASFYAEKSVRTVYPWAYEAARESLFPAT